MKTVCFKKIKIYVCTFIFSFGSHLSFSYYAPSLCPSVCPSVMYIANNSRTQRRTQRLSVPKFGMKVPDLRCDSHNSFKVKWSKVRVTDRLPCQLNPAASLLVFQCHDKHHLVYIIKYRI